MSNDWTALFSPDYTRSLSVHANPLPPVETDHTYMGTSGNNTITGTQHDDIFNMDQGGNDTVNGGKGDDTFNFGASLTAADKINGGAGNDILNLDGDYSAGLTFGGSTLTGIEHLNLAGGHSYDLTMANGNVAAGTIFFAWATTLTSADSFRFNGSAETNGEFSIEGANGDDVLIGGHGDDLIEPGLGHDIARGGDGKDVMYVAAAQIAGDTLDGGAGSQDTLFVFGNGTPSATVTFGATTTNFEVLNLYTLDINYTITTADATVAAGVRMLIVGENVDAAHTFHFNGAAETNGSFNILGGQGNDTLIGSRNGDIIQGNDGTDSMTGGKGSDEYAFLAVSNSTGVKFDTIHGFDASADKIGTGTDVGVVDPTVVGGTLNKNSFDSNLASAIGGAQLQENAAVLFEPNHGNEAGKVFLIVDGNSMAGYQAGADYVIQLSGSVHLSSLDSGDFVVV